MAAPGQPIRLANMAAAISHHRHCCKLASTRTRRSADGPLRTGSMASRADTVRRRSRRTRCRLTWENVDVCRRVGLSLAQRPAVRLQPQLAHAKPFMIVGTTRSAWDDDGKPCCRCRQGFVLIVDLANPRDAKIVATLPLKNSVVGPPVNVDTDPTSWWRWWRIRSTCKAATAEAVRPTRSTSSSSRPAAAGGDIAAASSPRAELQPVRQDGAGRHAATIDQRSVVQRHRRQGHRHRVPDIVARVMFTPVANARCR